MKRYEVTIETVEQREVHVFADSPGEAWEKAATFDDEQVSEGYNVDFERRVIAVRRDKDAKLYK